MLTLVRWNCVDTITAPLVATLNSHPTLKRLDIKVAHWGQENVIFAEELYSNPRIVSISADICYRDDGQEDYNILSDLKRLMTSSSNLKTLSLSFGLGGGGVEKERVQLTGFEAQEKIPALESLYLHNYAFETETDDALHYHLDIEKLQRLSLKYCSYGERLVSLFSKTCQSLRFFEINDPWPQSVLDSSPYVDQFLLSFTGLEELLLEHLGVLRPTLNSIFHHGSTLKVLKIHDSEWNSWNTRPAAHMMNPQVLQSIRDSCPLLEELYLDIDRWNLEEVRNYSPSWKRNNSKLIPVMQDSPMVEMLKSFPYLKKLAIYTPLGINKTQLIRPLVDASFALVVANRIWTPKIDIMEVISGEDRGVDAVAHRHFLWERDHRSHWKVNKDDNMELVVVDADLAAKEPMFRRWTKLLGEPFHGPPVDRRDRMVWEDELHRRVCVHGATAPNRLT